MGGWAVGAVNPGRDIQKCAGVGDVRASRRDRIDSEERCMNYENLTVERRGAIAVVTLNRPDRMNALSLDLMEELIRVADEFQDDLETRVVVFTGSGKHFSAGADLADKRRAEAARAPLLERQRSANLGPRLTRRLQEIHQITIAAINGGALGGGAVIVSALDFRVAGESAFVAYPEINLGMSLSWLGLPLCVHLVGPARAKRLVILGQREGAETLRAWGFVDEVVPDAELMDRALAMAEAYAAKPPIAAQMIKRSVNAIASALDASVMHMDIDQLLLTHSSEDYAEAIRAFFEKREPTFRGR
jgi:enoyl-CoA hydratase